MPQWSFVCELTGRLSSNVINGGDEATDPMNLIPLPRVKQ